MVHDFRSTMTTVDELFVFPVKEAENNSGNEAMTDKVHHPTTITFATDNVNDSGNIGSFPRRKSLTGFQPYQKKRPVSAAATPISQMNHQATYELSQRRSSMPNIPYPSHGRVGHVEVACMQCAKSRKRCSTQRPCLRCIDKCLDCQDRPRKSQEFTFAMSNAPSQSSLLSPPNSNNNTALSPPMLMITPEMTNFGANWINMNVYNMPHINNNMPHLNNGSSGNIPPMPTISSVPSMPSLSSMSNLSNLAHPPSQMNNMDSGLSIIGHSIHNSIDFLLPSTMYHSDSASSLDSIAFDNTTFYSAGSMPSIASSNWSSTLELNNNPTLLDFDHSHYADFGSLTDFNSFNVLSSLEETSEVESSSYLLDLMKTVALDSDFVEFMESPDLVSNIMNEAPIFDFGFCPPLMPQIA